MIVGQHSDPLMGIQGKDSLLPVSFSQEVCATPENIRKNVEATLSSEYEPLNDFLNTRRGAVSICGSGPSLKEHYRDLVGDVFACNAAHDFLIARGTIPGFAMLWDADEMLSRMVTPREDVTYFLASRCHPAVFEKFKGLKVRVWHAGGDACIEECLEQHQKMEPIINGGSAAVSRALFFCFALGYQELHLFGADSSCRGEETHVRKSLVPEKLMRIFCAGEWFDTTPWLAVQAEDFKLLAPALRDAGAKIVVHGDGLIPHIAQVLDFEVHPQPKENHVATPCV